MSDPKSQTTATWADPALEGALTECRNTYTGHGRCDHPEYLKARHRYHTLLVERGLLNPKLAERKPS